MAHGYGRGEGDVRLGDRTLSYRRIKTGNSEQADE